MFKLPFSVKISSGSFETNCIVYADNPDSAALKAKQFIRTSIANDHFLSWDKVGEGSNISSNDIRILNVGIVGYQSVYAD
jgi:hypothetical protein